MTAPAGAPTGALTPSDVDEAAWARLRSLAVAPETHTVPVPSDGVFTGLDALAGGAAAWRLGAGRARRGDPVQAVAGVEMHAKPGDAVRAGRPLLTLHAADPGRFERALEALAGAVVVAGPDSPAAARARERAAAGVVLERLAPGDGP